MIRTELLELQHSMEAVYAALTDVLQSTTALSAHRYAKRAHRALSTALLPYLTQLCSKQQDVGTTYQQHILSLPERFPRRITI